MTEQEVIKKAIKVRGITQAILAADAGFKRQSNVGELLRSRNLRVDNFVRLLNAMNFDVIVKDRNGNNRENVWKIDLREEETSGE